VSRACSDHELIEGGDGLDHRGLNHSKVLNKEAGALYQDKVRLLHELAEAHEKVRRVS
jgi:hypothetical protein